ncbi:DUF2066 domain-containing protein [Alteromonas flava]|uniref:DUF2066 domain-containing protein n=1 Tax=Alteromonas flava TaxID=2048003 RepID=UPI000C281BCC|nr:DUF2066 domain-containing protein [Alteromonas flava]
MDIQLAVIMHRTVKFAIGAWFFLSLTAFAQVQQSSESTVIATHVVKINVADQSQREQQRAVSTAFRRALIKMSGNRNQFDRAMWQRLDKQATALLKAYQYEIDNGDLNLIATFDKLKMQALLRDNQLKLWESRRPDSIIWLTVNEPSARDNFLLSESQPSELGQIVKKIAQQRGVNIVLPLYDLEDAQLVSLYDIWGRFTGPIKQANTRYGLTHSIVARVRRSPDYDPGALKQRIEELNQLREQSIEVQQALGVEQSDQVDKSAETEKVLDSNLNAPRTMTGLQEDSLEALGVTENTDEYQEVEEIVPVEPAALFSFEEFQALLADYQQYQLDYTYLIDSTVHSGTLGGDSPEQMVEELIQRYVDRLSERYAIESIVDEAGLVNASLAVTNIQRLSDYQQVFSLLSSLSVVESVQLQRLQGSQAYFDVRLFADFEQLIEALVLDGRLLPRLDAFGNVINTDELAWTPN